MPLNKETNQPTIQLNNHLFTHLNDQTVLFLTIQFNASHLFRFTPWELFLH